MMTVDEIADRFEKKQEIFFDKLSKKVEFIIDEIHKDNKFWIKANKKLEELDKRVKALE